MIVHWFLCLAGVGIIPAVFGLIVLYSSKFNSGTKMSGDVVFFSLMWSIFWLVLAITLKIAQGVHAGVSCV